MPVKKGLTLEDLQAHFHMPLAEVARKFGHCMTFMKKICRSHGIKRWPHRRVKCLQKKISSLQNRVEKRSETNLIKLTSKIEELRALRRLDDADDMLHPPAESSEGPLGDQDAVSTQDASHTQHIDKTSVDDTDACNDSSHERRDTVGLAGLVALATVVQESSSDDESLGRAGHEDKTSLQTETPVGVKQEPRKRGQTRSPMAPLTIHEVQTGGIDHGIDHWGAEGARA